MRYIDNKIGRTLTVGMGNKTLCGVIRTLTRLWLTKPIEVQTALAIARGAQEVDDFRNQLAHGSWEYPKGGKTTDIWMIYMKASAERIMPRAIKHHPREIRKYATKLRRLNEKAQKLIHRLDKR